MRRVRTADGEHALARLLGRASRRGPHQPAAHIARSREISDRRPGAGGASHSCNHGAYGRPAPVSVLPFLLEGARHTEVRDQRLTVRKQDVLRLTSRCTTPADGRSRGQAPHPGRFERPRPRAIVCHAEPCHEGSRHPHMASCTRAGRRSPPSRIREGCGGAADEPSCGSRGGSVQARATRQLRV